MRWVALGVDYEMAGKDLIDSVIQSGKIARVLGGRPPEGFNYEMFLDENGEKISKSKGNGLSLDEWLSYGSEESLAFYIYREPRKARACTSASSRGRSTNIGSSAAIMPTSRSSRSSAIRSTTSMPARCPRATLPITFGLLLNLVACRAAATRTLRGSSSSAMRRAVARDASRARRADRTARSITPRFRRARPEAPRARREVEAAALRDLDARLAAARGRRAPRRSRTTSSKSASATRSRACATGSRRFTKPCSAPSQGPRMGSFIALYGIANSRKPDRRGAGLALA